MSFANNYNTEEVHASNWRVCPDKVENRVKRYFKLTQSLKSKEIKIGKFKKDTIYVYSVDGVHFHTRESRKKPTKRVYSHKFHGPGVAYEVGIAIFENRILWSKGPFQAPRPDCTIFQQKDNGTFHPEMPQGKKGIAGSGYKHLNEYIAIHGEGHSKEMTNHINRVRACHENTYSRMKVFDILSDSFRGSWKNHDKHKMYSKDTSFLSSTTWKTAIPLWKHEKHTAIVHIIVLINIYNALLKKLY